MTIKDFVVPIDAMSLHLACHTLLTVDFAVNVVCSSLFSLQFFFKKLYYIIIVPNLPYYEG